MAGENVNESGQYEEAAQNYKPEGSQEQHQERPEPSNEGAKANPNLEQSYKHLQEAYRQSREEIKAFKKQFEDLNPKLQTIDRLKSAFGEQAQEKNFWQALPEDYQTKAERLEQQAQELAELKAQLGDTQKYLSAQAEQREFQAFDDSMAEIYNSKADIDLAKQKIKEYIPDALEQWQNGRSLESLHNEMLGKEYSNPDSPLIKSIQARAIAAKNRKASNFIDSTRGFGGGDFSGGEDDLISVVPSQD